MCPFEALSQIVMNGSASLQDFINQMNCYNLILINFKESFGKIVMAHVGFCISLCFATNTLEISFCIVFFARVLSLILTHNKP